ncbi:hypothetical protein S245_009079 [Arachis hypogaea]
MSSDDAGKPVPYPCRRPTGEGSSSSSFSHRKPAKCLHYFKFSHFWNLPIYAKLLGFVCRGSPDDHNYGGRRSVMLYGEE